MTDNEISLKLIDLYDAVRNENLENTKNLVNELNENISNDTTIYSVVETLNRINDRRNKNTEEYNEAYLYALKNITFVDIPEFTIWRAESLKLRIFGSDEEITNFVNETLEKDTISLEQFSNLISLVIYKNDYDSLELIRSKLNEED